MNLARSSVDPRPTPTPTAAQAPLHPPPDRKATNPSKPPAIPPIAQLIIPIVQNRIRFD